MKIQEFEAATGLDRATIRFYEKEGLLSPARQENGYRDYSENDLRDVQRIKLLRQLELPLETIKTLQQGRSELSEVLQQQIEVLQKKISSTTQALEICRKIQASESSYSSMDAAVYLQSFEEEGKASDSCAKTSYCDPNTVIEFHPVRRLAARLIDYYLLRLIVNVLFAAVFRIRPWPYNDFVKYCVDYGIPLLAIPIHAFFLSCFGTTPGKWLMGLRIVADTGEKLTFTNALQREWSVLLYGYGLGIPFIRLWRMYRSYKDYKDYGDSEWDHRSWFVYNDYKALKTAATITYIVIYLIATVFIAADSQLPKHRSNDMTVTQFAENYNFIAKTYDKSYSLNPDGTWYIPQSTQNGNYLIITGAVAENQNAAFVYETEGDHITRISYANSWKEISYFTPISGRIQTACIAVVASQKEVNFAEYFEFLSLMDQETGEEDGHILFENIEIRWTITAENCYRNQDSYVAKDQTEESKVSLSFEIIIH